MSEKFTIEIDEEFLKNFFELTEQIPPTKTQLNLNMMKDTIKELRLRVDELARLQELEEERAAEAAKDENRPRFNSKSTNNDSFGSFSIDNLNLNGEGSGQKILIVDDLGIITYQLSTLFTKRGFECVVSQEIYDAINKYKKQYFDLVLLDLFIPTEREGFLLLEEIAKINESNQKKSVIGIITASNKKQHKILCQQKGANFYVEKQDDWQKNLLEMFSKHTEI